MEIGKKIWAIAEGYIPGWSNGPEPEFTSHEAACILNASNEDAHIDLMIYYTDRKPAGPFKLVVKSQRTHHFRFNDLRDPETIPLATAYSSVFISNVPIIIQHTRLDSRQNANALISTIAYFDNSII